MKTEEGKDGKTGGGKMKLKPKQCPFCGKIPRVIEFSRSVFIEHSDNGCPLEMLLIEVKKWQRRVVK